MSIIRLVVAAAVLVASGQAQSRLFVSNDGTNVLAYNGSTGASQGVFVPTGGNLLVPSGVTFGPDGNFYLGSFANSRVLKFDGVTGASMGVFVTTGSGSLTLPAGIAFGPDGNLYVSSQGNSRILKYDGATGASLGTFVATGVGGLTAPDGLTFGPDGNLYVNSQGSLQILKYNGTTGAFIGTFVTAGSGGLLVPGGLAFGPDGNLYVTSIGNAMVVKYDGATGAPLGTFVTTGSGGLLAPSGLTFGPDGNLYVSSLNSRVLRYNGRTGASMGAFVTTGSGGLITPTYLVFSPDLSAESGKFQLKYFNTNYGSGKIILSNAGSISQGTNATDDSSGTVCANVYVFDPNEEMQTCCSCPVTPNGLASLDIAQDILAQSLIANPPQAVTVKILFTSKLLSRGQGGFCDPQTPTMFNLAKGGLAWGVNLRGLTAQGSPPAPVSAGTETEFSKAELSRAERSKLATYCRYIKILGSQVTGICKSCESGARGAVGY